MWSRGIPTSSEQDGQLRAPVFEDVMGRSEQTDFVGYRPHKSICSEQPTSFPTGIGIPARIGTLVHSAGPDLTLLPLAMGKPMRRRPAAPRSAADWHSLPAPSPGGARHDRRLDRIPTRTARAHARLRAAARTRHRPTTGTAAHPGWPGGRDRGGELPDDDGHHGEARHGRGDRAGRGRLRARVVAAQLDGNVEEAAPRRLGGRLLAWRVRRLRRPDRAVRREHDRRLHEARGHGHLAHHDRSGHERRPESRRPGALVLRGDPALHLRTRLPGRGLPAVGCGAAAGRPGPRLAAPALHGFPRGRAGARALCAGGSARRISPASRPHRLHLEPAGAVVRVRDVGSGEGAGRGDSPGRRSLRCCRTSFATRSRRAACCRRQSSPPPPSAP